MIKGLIVLEEIRIEFDQDYDSTLVKYTVSNRFNNETETKTVNGPAFFSALAIAVHNDGMPNYKTDYPSAESVQPVNPELRWIP